MVADINPGGNDSSPDDLTRVPEHAVLLRQRAPPATSSGGCAAPIPPAPDTTQPVVTTSAETKLKKSLVVEVTCDEACNVTGAGSVIAKGAKPEDKSAAKAKKQTFKLKGGSATLAAAGTAEVTLRFKGKDFKKAKAGQEGRGQALREAHDHRHRHGRQRQPPTSSS